MLCPPSHATDEQIAAAVAAHWLPEISAIAYLPVGFGAHHWQVSGGDTTLFVTLDQLDPRHTAASLEAAYAAAAALAPVVDLVWPGIPTRDGWFTVPFGAGALSVTPWLTGRTPAEPEAEEPRHISTVVAALASLHGARPPAGLRRWTPCAGPDFAEQLREWSAQEVRTGPLAAEARGAVAARLAAIGQWTRRYLELAERAAERRWVPTHGEPHFANQMITESGLKLVDWESLALAPRERDLLACGAGRCPEADPAMVELFELDWRLAEIAEYTRRFGASHPGNAEDLAALAALREELAADEHPASARRG